MHDYYTPLFVLAVLLASESYIVDKSFRSDHSTAQLQQERIALRKLQFLKKGFVASYKQQLLLQFSQFSSSASSSYLLLAAPWKILQTCKLSSEFHLECLQL